MDSARLFFNHAEEARLPAYLGLQPRTFLRRGIHENNAVPQFPQPSRQPASLSVPPANAATNQNERMRGQRLLQCRRAVSTEQDPNRDVFVHEPRFGHEIAISPLQELNRNVRLFQWQQKRNNLRGE